MTTKTKTTLLDQLGELEAAIPEREREVQQAQTEHSRRIRELAAARGRRQSYHREVAFGERKADAKEEARLDEAVREIERHVEVTTDRGGRREIHLVAQAKHEAAVARLDAARSDVARFIDANADGLLEELREQAEGPMRELLDEAIAAVGRFGAEAHRISRTARSSPSG